MQRRKFDYTSKKKNLMSSYFQIWNESNPVLPQSSKMESFETIVKDF